MKFYGDGKKIKIIFQADVAEKIIAQTEHSFLWVVFSMFVKSVQSEENLSLILFPHIKFYQFYIK